MNNKDYFIKTFDINNDEIDDKIVSTPSKEEQIVIKDNNIAMTVYYDNALSKEDLYENIIQEKENLEASITRRKKLLSNTGYITKAPQNIVDKEKSDLAIEEEKLANILKEL